MINTRRAVSLIKKAEDAFSSAIDDFKAGRYPDCVFSCQRCVEFATKSVLLTLGYLIPKSHDTSGVLGKAMTEKEMPEWFKEEIPKLGRIVNKLADQRVKSEYGLEVEGVWIDPYDIIDEGTASSTIEEAEWVLKLCSKFLIESGISDLRMK
ncbi:MAG: HEPN domain-containing protein [Candidatus Hydrothermarchaeota archaeon]